VPWSIYILSYIAGSNIYFASYTGKITVIKPGEKLNVLAKVFLREKLEHLCSA